MDETTSAFLMNTLCGAGTINSCTRRTDSPERLAEESTRTETAAERGHWRWAARTAGMSEAAKGDAAGVQHGTLKGNASLETETENTWGSFAGTRKQ